MKWVSRNDHGMCFFNCSLPCCRNDWGMYTAAWVVRWQNVCWLCVTTMPQCSAADHLMTLTQALVFSLHRRAFHWDPSNVRLRRGPSWGAATAPWHPAVHRWLAVVFAAPQLQESEQPGHPLLWIAGVFQVGQYAWLASLYNDRLCQSLHTLTSLPRKWANLFLQQSPLLSNSHLSRNHICPLSGLMNHCTSCLVSPEAVNQ